MLASSVALALAVTAAVVGLVRGTWAVGGSDSSCYALMADALARGELQPVSRLALEAPWPDAARTFAPGGFIPSPVRPDAASPICAPGFAVLLAPLRAMGGRDGIFVLAPAAGALVVWLTFVLGRRFGGAAAGVAAASIVAATPVFVFQLVQPMNDVLVAALWTGVVALAARMTSASPGAVGTSLRSAASGIGLGAVCGLAVLVRPNLAPAAVVVLAWIVWMARRANASPGRALAPFLAGLLPLVAVTSALNQQLYGAPLQSGYGSAADLFAVEHIPANLRNHGLALLETQLGLPIAGVAAALVLPSRQRPMVALVLGLAATMVSTYLLHTPFSEWWYLRFYLPAMPMMTALATATFAVAIARPWAIGLSALAMVIFMTASPAMRQALDLARLEKRFRVAGDVVRERLPPNAVFITVWASGSVKYHGGAEAMLWDSLDPPWLERTVQWWQRRGYTPYIVLEHWEEPLFRQRFESSLQIGRLDWPPRFEVEHQVRIFDPRDRARYLAGEAVPTEIVWADRP